MLFFFVLFCSLGLYFPEVFHECCFFRVCVPLVTILLLPFKTPYTLSAFFKALHPKITYGIMTLMCLHICNTLDLIACEQYFDFPTSFAFNLLPLPDLSHGFKPHPHYFFLVLFPAAPQKNDILTQLFFSTIICFLCFSLIKILPPIIRHKTVGFILSNRVMLSSKIVVKCNFSNKFRSFFR